MSSLARILPGHLLLAAALAVSASAGAAGARPLTVPAARARPPIALAASPAHVTIEGPGRATVRVTNSGSEAVVVDVRRAGFALDLRGRPRIVPAGERTARAWIAVRPRRFALGAGGGASVTVAATVPRRAEPGDHDALVLLTTRPRRRSGVAVRMRLGVVVAVRAPGDIVHELVLRSLRVGRKGRMRTLELLVHNRGNVTEQLGRDQVSLTLRRGGRAVARLRPEPRELLPRSRGIVLFRYRGRLRGTVSALATLVSEAGRRSVYRTYRIRL